MAEEFFSVEVDGGSVIDEEFKGDPSVNAGINDIEGIAEVAGGVFVIFIRAKGNGCGDAVFVSERC